MGRLPKPPGTHLGHSPSQAIGWTYLPPKGRKGPPPDLPAWRVWHPSTLEWWAALWRMPQATQWDQTGQSLHVAALLMDDLVAARSDAGRVSAELRQHLDRHGASGPRSLLALRWIIGEPPRPLGEPGPRRPAPTRRKRGDGTVTPLDERRARVIDALGRGGGDTAS